MNSYSQFNVDAFCSLSGRVSGIRVLREVIQVQKKTSPVLQGLDENGTAVEIEIVSSMCSFSISSWIVFGSFLLQQIWSNLIVYPRCKLLIKTVSDIGRCMNRSELKRQLLYNRAVWYSDFVIFIDHLTDCSILHAKFQWHFITYGKVNL